MSFLSYSAQFQGPVDAFLRDPNRYAPLALLLEQVMNGESELSQAQREMIALYTSKLNGCEYCIGAHRGILVELGISQSIVDELEQGRSFDAPMKPVLSFTEKLTRTPEAVSQIDVDRVLAAGWSEQTVEDIIGVVGVFSFFNRLLDGLGVTGNRAVHEQVGAMVAANGYAPVVNLVQSKAKTAA